MQMWPDLIQKSKQGGLDVIETYVFWNLHEPVRGQVIFLSRVKGIISFLDYSLLQFLHLIVFEDRESEKKCSINNQIFFLSFLF